MTSRPWSSKYVAWLRRPENAGLGADEIARRLKRTKGAVKQFASRFEISLRRPDSRCGAIIGTPRGARLEPSLRAALLEPDPELCPSCGRFPIRVSSTGLCRPCHLARLTEAHKAAVLQREHEFEEEREAEAAAKRELLMWRQRRCRAGATSPREAVAAQAL